MFGKGLFRETLSGRARQGIAHQCLTSRRRNLQGEGMRAGGAFNPGTPAGAWRRSSAARRRRHRGQPASCGRGVRGQTAWSTLIDDRPLRTVVAPVQIATILVTAEDGVRHTADCRHHAPTSIAPKFDGSHQVVQSRLARSFEAAIRSRCSKPSKYPGKYPGSSRTGILSIRPTQSLTQSSFTKNRRTFYARNLRLHTLAGGYWTTLYSAKFRTHLS